MELNKLHMDFGNTIICYVACLHSYFNYIMPHPNKIEVSYLIFVHHWTCLSKCCHCFVYRSNIVVLVSDIICKIFSDVFPIKTWDFSKVERFFGRQKTVLSLSLSRSLSLSHTHTHTHTHTSARARARVNLYETQYTSGRRSQIPSQVRHLTSWANRLALPS